MGALGWQQAWQDALYGPDGFYRQAGGPAGHFSTATHGPTGAVLAEAVVALARREGCSAVVDLGCGRGELLAHLHRLEPGLALTGVEVVERPDHLPPAVGWLVSPGGGALPAALTGLEHTLLVAHEWLDVVPCAVVETGADGVVRHLLVDPATGAEQPGPAVDGAEAAWLEQHWPAGAPGARAEVGLSRDLAWAELLRRVHSGVVLAVDYGHLAGDRPEHGSLAAYRAGTQTTPVPDGSCDLTAHVAMDSLDHDELTTQREALRGLGVDGSPPPHDRARTDPSGYLAALARSSAAAALLDPGGYGGFWWALSRRG